MGRLRLAYASMILISSQLISSHEIHCLVFTSWPGKSGTQTHFQLVLRCSSRSFSAWQVCSKFTPQKLCSTTGFCKGAGKLWRKRTETWRRRVLTALDFIRHIFFFAREQSWQAVDWLKKRGVRSMEKRSAESAEVIRTSFINFVENCCFLHVTLEKISWISNAMFATIHLPGFAFFGPRPSWRNCRAAGHGLRSYPGNKLVKVGWDDQESATSLHHIVFHVL